MGSSHSQIFLGHRTHTSPFKDGEIYDSTCSNFGTSFFLAKIYSLRYPTIFIYTLKALFNVPTRRKYDIFGKRT